MNKTEYLASLLNKYKKSLLFEDYQAYEEAKKLPEDFTYVSDVKPEDNSDSAPVRPQKNHKRR